MKTAHIIIALLFFLQVTEIQCSEMFFGTWETEPYLSQLGTVITKFYFKENKECSMSIRFLDAKLNEIEQNGFCNFNDRELEIKNKNGVFINTYTFINGILTITEKNGDTYKLKRKP